MSPADDFYMSEPRIQLHFTGDGYFNSALKAIESAKHEVLLESYIYDLDPIGLRFLSALSAAKKRGLKVFLMVDGIGSFNWQKALERSCYEHQIPLHVYHPLPFASGFSFSWKNLRRLLFFFRRVNRRNHRKIILIDRRHVFMGGLNISKTQSEEFLGEKAWRDTGIELEYETAMSDTHLLARAFYHTWRTSSWRKALLRPRSILKLPRKPRVRFPMLPQRFRLNTPPWVRYFLLRDLRRRIKLAKTRILITNAYFVPRRSVLAALRKAARRGVFVGLVLPSKTDVSFVREASRSLYYRLMKSGVHIYEYQPSILHAKTLVIDDWATVGSHNLNHRSMLHDLEIEAVVTEPEQINELVEQWDLDARKSKHYQIHDLGRFPWYQRTLSRVIYWFRYWI